MTIVVKDDTTEGTAVRTYNLYVLFAGAEFQLLSTQTIATFVQAVQALQLGGNISIRYKAGAGQWQTVQGFRVEVIDP